MVRLFNGNFNAGLADQEREPRYAVELDFGVGQLHVFLSHGNTSPAWTADFTFEHAIADITSAGQRLVVSEYRTTIGSTEVVLVDGDRDLTIRYNALIDAGFEPGNVLARFYLGWEGLAPSDYELMATQTVAKIDEFPGGGYRIRTEEITTLANREVFSLWQTELRASYGAADTTIPVVDAASVEFLDHGPAFADLPNTANVAYAKLQDEIVSFTAVDIATQGQHNLLNCRRGLFGTTAVAYVHNASVNPPPVREVVYMEMSVIHAARAILTGFVETGVTLPSNWHAGISKPFFIDDDAWESVGTDLWDPNDQAAGLTVRIFDVETEMAKDFVESELWPIANVFMRVLSTGRLGLRRIATVEVDTPSVLTLNESTLLRLNRIEYDKSSVRNRTKIEWNWNGERTTRANLFIDDSSVSRYGPSKVRPYRLRALHGSIHTSAVLRTIRDRQRDRLSEAGLRTKARAVGAGLGVEVGDVVRVSVANRRDFSAPLDAQGPPLDRSFEVHNARFNWRNISVDFDLFASSRRPEVIPACDDVNVLPASFYPSEGNQIPNVVADVLDQDVLLNGNGQGLDQSANIFYHDGDLTIPDGRNITIGQNVQIRINGTLVVNGTIQGAGNGLQTQTDSAVNLDLPAPTAGPPGRTGYLGPTQGSDGVLSLAVPPVDLPFPSTLTPGQVDSVPGFAIENNSTGVLGFPSTLMGTSGPFGGRSVEEVTPGLFRHNRGSAGGRGGAGLLIVCRGMVFGPNGNIDLSGGDGALQTITPNTGVGGGGAPGACVVLLDGSLALIPVFNSSTFTARYGAQNPNTGPVPGADLSAVAFRVQFVPCSEEPLPD